MTDRWTRLAPLTGVIAAVLAVSAGIVTGSDRPSGDAAADEVIAFYTDKDSAQIAASILFAYAALFLVFFAGALRVALRRGEAHGGLSALTLAGGVITALGMLIIAGLTFTLADTADSLDPAAAQALNALNEDFFFPLAIGLATLFLASGIAIVRGTALPAWLGWVAIVIGIAALTPVAFGALFFGGIWILVVSVWLAARPVAGQA